jgi:hypothetical protein
VKTARPVALAVLIILASSSLLRADSFGDLKEIAATAAPASIADRATYYYLDPEGVFMQLSEGTNGLWCIAPSLALRGPRVPMCGDAVALEWLRAWIDGREPTPGAPGIIYALAGGRDASAVNPLKAEPDGNLPWIETGPMMMIVNPPDAELALYPATEHPDTSMPYVMWSETPFAHLRLPVE